MTIEEVNNLSYEEALRLWRFSPVGSVKSGSELAEAFERRFTELRREESDAEKVRVSKALGWRQ